MAMAEKPYHAGTYWEREGVVKILLDHRNVEPDLPDWSGRTPLSLAISRGHESAVKLLPERRDANTNLLDTNDRTPLLSSTVTE